ncbi:hypothetical protein A6F68_01896 [Tsuneonella dongtanensis]|uniref:Uncharacterized protein n=1 Tax=Tsuneonella dongtanensis TaxID=692370 RepID=A0A1B2AE38_9SPHN|nr:hypothetical protein [Tsuneonella dongtanensis]ANY20406.1 hypothetical protein A6F68_01896 [Tsuneonella dongtanensis]
MAHQGIGFFDGRGHFFKTPDEATISDLAALLGRIGDGESLAPGIAQTLLCRRDDLERLFREHDEMMAGAGANVTKLPTRERPAA